LRWEYKPIGSYSIKCLSHQESGWYRENGKTLVPEWDGSL
jgi:hypothetical protein